MIRIGYTLSSEEHAPTTLVENARRAEDAGFDFLTISDHFHPWVSAQGHSPFVWGVLGAVAAVTERVDVAVGVSCPTVRVHPAIVAQAAATASLLLEGRFLLGVGTGEALNEHILGDHWPRPAVRRAMLREAVELMRSLWTGETVDHDGDFYVVENARLFDPPGSPLPVVVSGFGDAAVALAAEIGDGYWGHSPDPGPVDAYRAAGGTGPRFAQVNLCWAEQADTARKTVHHQWPNSALPGQLAQDLPTWTHVEQAAELVRVEDAVDHIPCGPDPEPIVAAVEAFRDAGYDHLHLHQIGPDQRGFLDAWVHTLGPALRQLDGVALAS